MTTPTPAAPPQGYEWKLTDDGSWSLYSSHYQEATHSSAGAWTETIVRYLEGCGVEEIIQSKSVETVNILEVGVGTGTGLVALLQMFKRTPQVKLSYLGLEIDENLIIWMQKNIETLLPKKFGPLEFRPIKELKKQNVGSNHESYRFKSDHLSIEILVGDAKLTFPWWQTKNKEKKFHAIFQDAFSPKNNPDLWDEQWFLALKSSCEVDGILSTFSAASKVKQALTLSGWDIFEGPKFGNKRGSTLARPK
ncbi:MAG: MnmC family methyltransferase [Bacteriovoracaceae bacterium]|nr:MnmC family methyltransferase [Bacteriovoracaceae bacterium]